jgi:hypothetical protein
LTSFGRATDAGKGNIYQFSFSIVDKHMCFIAMKFQTFFPCFGVELIVANLLMGKLVVMVAVLVEMPKVLGP